MNKKDKLESLIEQYNNMFPSEFPSIPLFEQGIERCIVIINDCIRKKKDVYELNYCTLDMDILY